MFIYYFSVAIKRGPYLSRPLTQVLCKYKSCVLVEGVGSEPSWSIVWARLPFSCGKLDSFVDCQRGWRNYLQTPEWIGCFGTNTISPKTLACLIRTNTCYFDDNSCYDTHVSCFLHVVNAQKLYPQTVWLLSFNRNWTKVPAAATASSLAVSETTLSFCDTQGLLIAFLNHLIF